MVLVISFTNQSLTDYDTLYAMSEVYEHTVIYHFTASPTTSLSTARY